MREVLFCLFLFWLPLCRAVACGEFLDWHLLPQFDDISFVGSSIVLHPRTVALPYTVPELRTFLFTPGSGQLRVVVSDSQQGGSGSAIAAKTRRIAETLSLVIAQPYCAEGEDRPREIKLRDEPVQLDMDQCLDITALEYADDTLYLGSSFVGECAMESRGGGIEVRKLSDWSLLGRIPAEALPGEMVRVIAENPKDGSVWVATERGLAQFDRNYQRVWRGFLQEEFDDDSGMPSYAVKSISVGGDDYATLARLLDVADIDRYRAKVNKLSEDERRRLEIGFFFMSGSYEERPRELNFLVDYFIDAYLHGDEWTKEFALWNICDFNDPAARTFMAMKDASSTNERAWAIFRRDCATREEQGLWRLDPKSVHEKLHYWRPEG